MVSKIKEWIEHEDIRMGISELTKKTGATTRQLRYWEKKGYIKSIQPDPNSPRAYKLSDIIKVELIKEYLDSGYTLSMAYEKAIKKLSKMQRFREVFSNYIKDVEILDDQYEVFTIGPFDETNEKITITHDSKNNLLRYSIKQIEGN
ncbi:MULTISPECIES: MerR family transcriptional regulator [Vagococcus]|uniref:MerR family transcriptional regulator n=1 Tax=Vagococcus TaxID=2737 RepID=UPI000E549DE9|nr:MULTISPECIES: MerR family transcriptional regulator [Vagococcus]RHH67596.1 MerR family transcriptional regulator [Vagococcus sp. AM17-17]